MRLQQEQKPDGTGPCGLGECVTSLLWAMGSLSKMEAEEGQGHLLSWYLLYCDTFLNQESVSLFSLI